MLQFLQAQWNRIFWFSGSGLFCAGMPEVPVYTAGGAEKESFEKSHI